MQQHTNHVKLEKRGDITLLDIKGDVTAFSEPFLNEAYEGSKDLGNDKLLFVFEQEAYINSGGIAVLIQILAKTKKNNQEIGITGLSDHFKKVFHMVGITKFATIHASPDEALKAMSAGA